MSSKTIQKGNDMRKLLLVFCSLLLFVSVAMAKGKLVSQWSCGKPSEAHSIDAGDQANHTYSISKTTCTATKSDVGGVKEKEGVGTQFNENLSDTTTWHGVFVVTAENGDKIHYTYGSVGKGTLKDGQLQSGNNKWSMVGGTGKFAGAKGSGTCQGKGNPDGTVTWDCQGRYTLGK
jgi:hypothetical protein